MSLMLPVLDVVGPEMLGELEFIEPLLDRAPEALPDIEPEAAVEEPELGLLFAVEFELLEEP